MVASRTYTSTPSSGNVTDIVTVTTGQFLTGGSSCTSWDNNGVGANVMAYDQTNALLGYLGGCGSESWTSTGRVTVAGYIPLQRLPFNVAYLVVNAATNSGNAANIAYIEIKVFDAK